MADLETVVAISTAQEGGGKVTAASRQLPVVVTLSGVISGAEKVDGFRVLGFIDFPVVFKRDLEGKVALSKKVSSTY